MHEYEQYEKKYQKELEEYEDYRRQLKEYAEYQRDLKKYRDAHFEEFGKLPSDIEDLDPEFSYEKWDKEEEQFLKDYGYQTKPPPQRKLLEEQKRLEEEKKEKEEKIVKWGVEKRDLSLKPKCKVCSLFFCNLTFTNFFFEGNDKYKTDCALWSKEAKSCECSSSQNS